MTPAAQHIESARMPTSHTFVEPVCRRGSLRGERETGEIELAHHRLQLDEAGCPAADDLQAELSLGPPPDPLDHVMERTCHRSRLLVEVAVHHLAPAAVSHLDIDAPGH
jgi:hypothetical protein